MKYPHAVQALENAIKQAEQQFEDVFKHSAVDCRKEQYEQRIADMRAELESLKKL